MYDYAVAMWFGAQATALRYCAIPVSMAFAIEAPYRAHMESSERSSDPVCCGSVALLATCSGPSDSSNSGLELETIELEHAINTTTVHVC